MPRTPTTRGVGHFTGVQRVVTVPQAVVGTDWVYTLPGEGWWRILGMHTTFVTGAGATTRLVLSQYTLGGVIVCRWGGQLAQNASTTWDLSWVAAPNVGFSSATSPTFADIQVAPDFLLQPGGTIGSITLNLQPTDQYQAVNLLLEEYFSDEYEPERGGQWASTIESLAHHPEFAHIG